MTRTDRPRRVACPVCGSHKAVTRAGRLHFHGYHRGTPGGGGCPGSAARLVELAFPVEGPSGRTRFVVVYEGAWYDPDGPTRV